MTARNLPIGFINGWTVERREAEQPSIGGSFETGNNLAGSNASGVGVNTGDFNPNLASWRRIPQVPFVASMHMGGSGYGEGDRLTFPVLGVLPDGSFAGIAFVQAEQDTPPLGVLDPNGVSAINRTADVVPAGQWVFGTISVSEVDPGFRMTGGKDENRITSDGIYRVVV